MAKPPVAACPLLERLQADMTASMRAGDKKRLITVRMAIAEIQRAQIDGQRALDDSEALAILARMVKQRRDSAEQFRAGQRKDLADRENAEIDILRGFMPEPFSQDQVDAMIDAAITQAGATSPKDIGPVMGALAPQLQGRADMRAVSAQIKQRLS